MTAHPLAFQVRKFGAEVFGNEFFCVLPVLAFLFLLAASAARAVTTGAGPGGVGITNGTSQ